MSSILCLFSLYRTIIFQTFHLHYFYYNLFYCYIYISFVHGHRCLSRAEVFFQYCGSNFKESCQLPGMDTGNQILLHIQTSRAVDLWAISPVQMEASSFNNYSFNNFHCFFTSFNDITDIPSNMHHFGNLCSVLS